MGVWYKMKSIVKNILYVTSVDISLDCGPGINEREFICGLHRFLGKRIHFLIPQPQRKLDDISDFEDIITYYKRNNFNNPFVVIWHNFSQVRDFIRLIEVTDYALIVFRLDLFPMGAYIISKYFRVPYYIKTLEFFDYFNTQKGLKGILGRIAYPTAGFIHKQIVSKAIAVDVCTEKFIEFFKKRLNADTDKIYYIDNSTNVQRFKPLNKNSARIETGLEKYDKIIGFVGGHPFERGGRQMILMAPLLSRKHKNIGFVVVGGSEAEVKRLIREAVKNGVEDRFIFKGAVPYEDVVNYINSFDICLSFDLIDRTNLFGNASQKVRQYIACGKPVIAGLDGNEFLVEEQLGSNVDPGNIEEIAGVVNYWLGMNSEQEKSHSERAYQYACRNLSFENGIHKRFTIWNKYIEL